jgi:hypothetical protein
VWPLNKLNNRSRFGFQNALHDQLALAIYHGNLDRCLVNIHPDVFLLVHNGAALRQVVIRTITTYHKVGGTFYIAYSCI